jgi:8-oxo-dGTP pyrophosphatase MutT (NUDIX family)
VTKQTGDCTIMQIDNSDPNVARETKKNPIRNVAVVGIFDTHSNLLLVRTKRFPDHWQPIGGGMKATDMSPVDTLMREVKEETGIEFKADQFKLHFTTNYDFGEGTVYFYIASMPPDLSPVFDLNELAEWKWFALAELNNLQTFPATKKFFTSLQQITKL